jgi:phosphate starvation-inducible PhoH-like protein
LTARNQIRITSADETVIQAFRDLASRLGLHIFPNNKGRLADHVIASAQLYQLLLHLGMTASTAAHKTVPHAVLTAPENIAAAYLRGLFDTDGTVEKRDGVVTLCSISEELIRQVQVILLNFGIVAIKADKRTKYKGQPHLSYLLTIAGAEAERFHELIGFGLERKRARRQVRPSNVNVDVVPHIALKVREAMSSGTFTRAEHHRFHDYKTGHRRPSYAKLEEFIALLLARQVQNQALNHLQELLERRWLFLEVTSLTPSRAQVFDLTVPGTHSFIANGFVNHNSYLAVALALHALTQKQVNRIILTRPAVEAGEKLGYLPGDLQEKVDPYLRPLYDALFDLMEQEKVTKLLEKRVIEIAPLAFMRGRTLSSAFIILDEAQNTTSEQMKMFLTRIGFGSKAVITGDVTQVDLPTGRRSGLVEAARLLQDIEGIAFTYFTDKDVVRHRLVQMIIKAYEANSSKMAI